MTKKRILIQLDTDAQPSTFDGVVAVDADVDYLFRHANVTPESVQGLVHGAMFTRGGEDLASTAIFIGGSDVAAGSAVLKAVTKTFFGPVRVSVMLDSAGANTTAAAAVLAAGRHVSLSGATALVLAATGPVGRRVVRLLARQGAQVRAASRSVDRAQQVCDSVATVIKDAAVEGAKLDPHETSSPAGLAAALDGVQVVISAGAAGIELLTEADREACQTLDVAIDLCAVPPLGIGGIEVTDKAVERPRGGDGLTVCYGALGVGGMKMKIHKAALRRLFTSNDQVLDAEEIYDLGRESVSLT